MQQHCFVERSIVEVHTDRGREVLAGRPATIDVAFLVSRFEEMQEFRGARAASGGADEEPPATFDDAAGAWAPREGVEERIREKLERSIPNEATRRSALELLAFAIENADEERSDVTVLDAVEVTARRRHWN